MYQRGTQLLHKKEEQDSYDSNINPFEENAQVDEVDEDKQSLNKKTKKTKKVKKDKRQKKSKKLRKSNKKKQKEDSDFGEQDEESRNSMFDDQAESGQQDEDDEEAEIGFEQERERFEQLYRRPNATERLLQKLEGKNQRQINAQYSKRVNAIRNQGEAFPSQKDPKTFIVKVKINKEEQLVLSILNKAKYYLLNSKRVKIMSVMAFKKRFPGQIFVQAYTEKDVREFLQGFIHIYIGKKIQQLQNERYTSIFFKPTAEKIDFKQNTFIRITKGLYEGDLGKVFKSKKNSIDVMVVPRINPHEIMKKILALTDKIEDETAKKTKKQELFKLLINHKENNYSSRPLKKQLYQSDFAEFKNVEGVKNIRLGNMNGLIILNYRTDELQRVHGTYLPIQMLPFTTQGKLIDEIKEDIGNFATLIQFKKGEDVQIIEGPMEKHYGTLIEVKKNVGVIRCKNKDMKDQILQQPLGNLAKKFKLGQRVKVNSGIQAGKVGVIIKIQPKHAIIWTQNESQIKVNKGSLQLYFAQPICDENVHNLTKNDLIKTNKNVVGIVLETTKDSIKILNTNNNIQIVNNMDFDQKINSKPLVSINKDGEQLKSGYIVSIKSGVNQAKKCSVLHVYRQNVFLFNANLSKNTGILCESAQNCSLLSKNDTGKLITKTKLPSQDQIVGYGQQIELGKPIIIKSGLYKGYSGIVKVITPDKLQVRIVTKSVTTWVPIKDQITKQAPQKQQLGKTPNLQSVRGFNRSIRRIEEF